MVVTHTAAVMFSLPPGVRITQVDAGGVTIFDNGLAVDDGGAVLATSSSTNDLLQLFVNMQPPNVYTGSVLRIDGYQV